MQRRTRKKACAAGIVKKTGDNYDVQVLGDHEFNFYEENADQNLKEALEQIKF